jgi:hypothetical protein
MRGGGDCGVSANEHSCAHGAQINFGDLAPYLTYAAHLFHCLTGYIKIRQGMTVHTGTHRTWDILSKGRKVPESTGTLPTETLRNVTVFSCHLFLVNEDYRGLRMFFFYQSSC